MSGLLLSYAIINIILGTLLYILRNNSLAVIALILSMIALGTVILLRLNNIAARIENNIEVINKGQLNKNVKKTGIGIFDRISSRMNDFISKVRGLIASFGSINREVVKDAHAIEKQAEIIKYSSGEIATTIQNVAESVSDQAAYTLNIMGMVQSFARDAEGISENAEASLNIAKETKDIIEESFGKFSEIRFKIQESKEYNSKVLEALDSLDSKIKAIDSITEAVEGIAAQTQLLALNAAIEAARAGDAGRGFAVVAGEVGKLAEGSSQSAKEIKQLVDGITGQISELSVNIKDEAGAIDQNLLYATEVLGKSGVISDTLSGNMQAAEKITVLTKEQTKSIGSIEKEIEKINDITQQNAAISEEIGASTQEQLATVEAVHGNIVQLLERLRESDLVLADFMEGFELNDDIKKKIEMTKELVKETAKRTDLLCSDGSSALKFLKEQQSKAKFVEFMAYINPKGYNEASTVEVPENLKDCTAKPYFTKVSQGEIYVSEEYISIATKNYNITVSVPVQRNGAFGGVVMADININED